MARGQEPSDRVCSSDWGQAPEVGGPDVGPFDRKKTESPHHEAVLADVLARAVLPALLSQHSDLIIQADGGLHPGEANIQKLSALILGPDNADAVEYINSLRDRGVSLDDLHLELIEPTARRLGELWDADQVDFIAVTMGISRLQRIVHHFADLDSVQSYDSKRRALIMVLPGDNHRFGNQIVQKFLTAAGWSVLTLAGTETHKVVDLVAREWLAVVGVSINGDMQTDALASVIKAIRASSMNPHIGVMIGGPVLVTRPDLVEELGADGTATNAATAVVLAKKLLAQGLLAAAREVGD